jgi:hypothetical protein
MENEGAEQLAIIAETRAAVADRLITPWWYHPALGLMLAGYTVGLSLGGTAVRFAAVALFLAGCGVLVTVYRRRTGVWISGFDAGRASRWAKALGALAGVALAASWSIAYWTDLTWPVWCLAAVAFAGAVLLGRRFDTALREQLRAGA